MCLALWSSPSLSSGTGSRVGGALSLAVPARGRTLHGGDCSSPHPLGPYRRNAVLSIRALAVVQYSTAACPHIDGPSTSLQTFPFLSVCPPPLPVCRQVWRLRRRPPAVRRLHAGRALLREGLHHGGAGGGQTGARGMQPIHLRRLRRSAPHGVGVQV